MTHAQDRQAETAPFSAWVHDRWLGKPGICWSCAEPAGAIAFTLLGWLDCSAGAASAALWGYACFCEDCSRDMAALQAEAQPLEKSLEQLLQENPIPRHALTTCRKEGRRATMAGLFPGPLRSLDPRWLDGGRAILPESAPIPYVPALGDGPDPWDAPDVEEERIDSAMDRRMARRRPLRD